MKAPISETTQVLIPHQLIEGADFLEMWKFRVGNDVPVYDVKTPQAFNQLIGYSKYANREYGNVYYRGLNGLFDNAMPALLRNDIGKRDKVQDHGLTATLAKIGESEIMKKSLQLKPQISEKNPHAKKVNKQIRKYNGYVIEGMLQHYSGRTRFLDLVDNHWIALWMGLQNFVTFGPANQHCRCERRHINTCDIAEHLLSPIPDKSLQPYVYVYMLALPYLPYKGNGIWENSDFVEVDLRRALPSNYQRPHAQHALVVRRHTDNNKENKASFFDLASQVTGIIRIRLDRANAWIGEGVLMTQANLFPSPAVDSGYNTLLLNPELFKHEFRIVKYF